MLKLNSCPRCGGAVLIDRDQYGWYEQCLHCGYEHDLKHVDGFQNPGKVGVKAS